MRIATELVHGLLVLGLCLPWAGSLGGVSLCLGGNGHVGVVTEDGSANCADAECSHAPGTGLPTLARPGVSAVHSANCLDVPVPATDLTGPTGSRSRERATFVAASDPAAAFAGRLPVGPDIICFAVAPIPPGPPGILAGVILQI